MSLDPDRPFCVYSHFQSDGPLRSKGILQYECPTLADALTWSDRLWQSGRYALVLVEETTPAGAFIRHRLDMFHDMRPFVAPPRSRPSVLSG